MALRKIYLFMMVSLDGYFEGPKHDLSWHNVDKEFNAFANRQLKETSTLLLGRRTYQLFADFWPAAAKNPRMPKDVLLTGRLMNKMKKVVFSRTLKRAGWENTRLVSGGAFREVAKLKREPGKDIAILGSNNLCVSLMEKGLVDEFRLMVNPVAIERGTPLFKGAKRRVKLKLIRAKTFKNGNILLYYQLARKR